MRILVVGAGASIEEARRANAPPELWPPTIANFAKKLWDTPPNASFFNYWLPDYLAAQGIDSGTDPTSLFIELAAHPNSAINVERLFEFCWVNRGKKFPGDWENLIHHGILNPLTFLLIKVFGNGDRHLNAGALVASKLTDGDLVLSLNYETLFEIAATQCGHQLTYLPSKSSGSGLLIAKPHGSINLLADEHRFWFSQPNCIGALPSSEDGFRNWRGIVPPRFNKTYSQHPIAKMILECVVNIRPDTITFWGVGLTDSDVDLLDIYRAWCKSNPSIEVINPDETVSLRIREILGLQVHHVQTIEHWLSSQS